MKLFHFASSKPEGAARGPQSFPSAHVRLTLLLLAGLILTPLSFAFAKQDNLNGLPTRPDRHVIDQAGILSPAAKGQAELLLSRYESQTGIQIVFASIPTLNGQDIESFSIRLVDAWKIGRAGKDDGILFLIAKTEKKMRIEVGYGLEGNLTDAAASLILSQQAMPLFRANKWDQGILLSLQSIIQTASPDLAGLNMQPTRPQPIARQNANILPFLLFIFVAGLSIFFLDIGRFMGYRRSHQLHRERYSFWEWFFRFAFLLMILNIIFRVLIYSMLTSRGGHYGSRSGFGGFRGGGGSFGGGGASGGW